MAKRPPNQLPQTPTQNPPHPHHLAKQPTHQTKGHTISSLVDNTTHPTNKTAGHQAILATKDRNYAKKLTIYNIRKKRYDKQQRNK